jgi:hypothetical protein
VVGKGRKRTVMPWMLSRNTLRCRFAPPLPKPLPPLPRPDILYELMMIKLKN